MYILISGPLWEECWYLGVCACRWSVLAVAARIILVRFLGWYLRMLDNGRCWTNVYFIGGGFLHAKH